MLTLNELVLKCHCLMPWYAGTGAKCWPISALEIGLGLGLLPIVFILGLFNA